MGGDRSDQDHGIAASSDEYSRFDQVEKPSYHLAESADGSEEFDEDFRFTSLSLEPLLRGEASDRESFAAELGKAMESIGFAILEGHGLDPRLFEGAADAVDELFTRTTREERLPYRAQRHGSVREGYFPIKETSDIHPDLVEGWVFGRRAFDLAGDPGFDARKFWPRPNLEPGFRRLIEAELTLALPILQSVLTYLGCDPQLYDTRLAEPDFGQRLNYYPALTAEELASGAGRLLGHEDVDLFTLLPAPATEGLQVLHRSGKWVRLNAPPGSIILNTGDYLQRLSNDLLPSTTHRVSPPRDPALRAQARISFPLALYLKPDELLEVLPVFEEPKYEPIRVITFHTRTTAKFYGEDYAVEEEDAADGEASPNA